MNKNKLKNIESIKIRDGGRDYGGFKIGFHMVGN